MTRHTVMFAGAMALLAAISLVSAQNNPQEKKGATAPSTPQAMNQEMAKWMEMNTLGPEHDTFKGMVGTWTTESKWWMHPSAPPMVSQGTAEFELIFDGRYVQQKYDCPSGAMPFKGMGIIGYDRFKKQYVSMWIDSLSTGILISKGTLDADGKSITYYGTYDDPMTGGRDRMMRSVAREIDENKTIFEMYDKRSGMDEFMSMQITYTRQ